MSAVLPILRRALLAALTPLPATTRRTHPLYVGLLLLGLVLIPSWQSRFLGDTPSITPQYANAAATGIHSEPKFFYFLYHLNLFPLVTTSTIGADTRAEARRIVREEGASLRVEDRGTFRSGDRGRVWLYYPHAWIAKDAVHPRLAWGNAIGLWFALDALWLAFWWVRRPAFGAASVLLLGSNSFLLYSTYKQENVLGWPVTCAIALLAMHLPLMLARVPRAGWTWSVPLLAAFWLATMRTVRSEPTLMAASALLVYLTMSGLSWRRRGAHALVFVASFGAMTAGYGAWFKHKLTAANAVIVANGGTAYTGPFEVYHEVWHPIFCGLGDFDTSKGYAWNDNVAYDYARPVLLAKYGVKMPETKPGYWGQSTESWDGTGKYPKWVHEVPHYHDVIRDHVIADIKADPKWYLGIVAKRIERILKEPSPISVQLGGGEPWREQSAFLGPASLALTVLLVLSRRWASLKLLLFMTPLSAPALVIYSGKGMQNIGCFHLFAFVIVCAMMLEGARRWLARPSSAG